MAKKIHLTQKDHDFIGRTLKDFRGRGRGEIPLPRRRRVHEGGRGTDGASGTFVCTLDAPIAPSTAGDGEQMEDGTGTVFEIPAGGELNELGNRTIFNPFRSTLPYQVATEPVQYTCAKTTDSETDANDEFTITGLDPYWLLAALTGFGADKLLRATGPDPANMDWAGNCLSFVTNVECVDGEIQLTTATYIAIACTP